MRKIIFLIFIFAILKTPLVVSQTRDFVTTFEISNGTKTATYQEVVTFYKKLATTHPEISIFIMGKTDSGKPLHLIVFNADGKTNFSSIQKTAKNKILINNGIHPGEPDGIDASMLLLRDIVQSTKLKKQYKNTLICVIPVYNIGGALHRNSYSRANQNGPKAYGFRGNARNFDLNRDFIKQDTKNTASFAQIFHAVNPDIFIDNHVSNGADYQYAITHLFTQHNKLGGNLGVFLEEKMRSEIEQSLLKKNIIITPYVNVWGTTPDKGFSQFFDSPRYSTGYTTLFNTLGLMVETHMLKPYKTRVKQTYELMISTLDFLEKNGKEIKVLREKSIENLLKKKTYPIAFYVDKKQPTFLEFKGYKGTYINSKITTGKRLFYDRTKPYNKTIPYYNNFKISKEITIPKAYILQQGWWKVIERLQNNQIDFTRFTKDTIITVEEQHIANYNTRKKAYEGHYLHYNTSVSTSVKDVTFKKGDIYIPTHQKGIRYIIETLESEATDSFFNWNFFDTILQQKEGFSSYVFEDIATLFLETHPQIKKNFEEKIKIDSLFAKNPYAQLKYIYQQTPHYEKVHLRLPIFKVK